ncbi:MAG: rhodanese-like domain-containing protein [Alphaproteobacteria bacterium]
MRSLRIVFMIILLIVSAISVTAHAADLLIPAQKAANLVAKGDLVIVDIRPQKKCNKTGKAKGSYNIPVAQDDSLKILFHKIVKAHGKKYLQKIAIMCKKGRVAAGIAGEYHRLGLTNVLSIEGGMEGSKGWLEQKLPIETCKKNA